MADHDDRLALSFDFRKGAFDFWRAHAEFVGEAMIADEIRVSLQTAFRASSRAGRVGIGALKCDAHFLPVRDDGAGQRMFRVRINSGGDAEDFVFRPAVPWLNGQHARPAFGDRSGFVHGESAKHSDGFQMRASFDENTAP